FIIWPAQKKILGGKVTGDELAATRKTAALASRINTFLSGPMLFGMLGAPHFAQGGFGPMIAFIVVSLLSIKLAYGLSTTELPKAIE
ncbi:MAG: hypothetical protein HY553_17645, partial [Elusimicrobia bacterium]|nr:hypothetical protein [Elusimicrobiota bacterium]